jgi:hypothetical protein
MERTIKTLRKVIQRKEVTANEVDMYLHNKDFLISKVLPRRLFYKKAGESKYLCVTFRYGEYDKPIVISVDSIDLRLNSWTE